MVDYGKFRKSLKALELQFQNYQNQDKRAELAEIDQEAIGESVIQRFEVCYDSLWKALKRYLVELGLPDLPNSPKPLFRIAFENRLFSNIEQWLIYANARVDTSHDYSETKAHEALALIGGFIDDAAALYGTLSGETWI